MRNIEEYNWTTNRTVYSRSRKKNLEAKSEIYCSYCRYHGGENDKNKWYHIPKEDVIVPSYLVGLYNRKRMPNWKLVSKNRKQWMKKIFKFENRSLNITLSW